MTFIVEVHSSVTGKHLGDALYADMQTINFVDRYNVGYDFYDPSMVGLGVKEGKAYRQDIVKTVLVNASGRSINNEPSNVVKQTFVSNHYMFTNVRQADGSTIGQWVQHT